MPPSPPIIDEIAAAMEVRMVVLPTMWRIMKNGAIFCTVIRAHACGQASAFITEGNHW